ncbi:MAG: M20/M25/M40 family metallo-hydrolase [Bacteroidota bacterium]
MKKNQFVQLLLALSLLLLLLTACITSKKSNPHLHQEIGQQADEIFDKLVNIRRDLHQYPELAGLEKRTSEIIADYLSNLGLEVKTGIAGYGVVGILKGGKEGKNIAWRADMDAVRSWIPEKGAFKSKIRGAQHSCGHDIHIAIGLGIAEVLSQNKASINGTVYFIFQPEEETFLGAKNMASSDLFPAMTIDEIYTLHVTALPLGQLMVKANELYAYQKRIKFTFDSQFSEDDAKALYDTIRKEMLRKEEGGNPWEVQKAFDSNIGIHQPNTIFKDYCFLQERAIIKADSHQLIVVAELYETNESNVSKLLPKIKRIINQSAFKDAFIDASYIMENPTVMNHPQLTNDASNVLNTIYGEGTVVPSYGQIPYFNDDFIYFQQQVPGVYFLLGGSNLEKGIFAMNHAPNFRVDETCIKIGIQSFSSLIFERTNRE